jgi:hypothetical protein
MTNTVINNKSYKTAQITAKGNVYSVTQMSSELGLIYVQIVKETNNPFKTSGKTFTTWDEAQQNYKCPEIKVSLLMLENNFKNI